MDPAGQPDLHGEADDRQVEGHLCQKCGDRVGRRRAFDRLGRHVELLIDDGRADRRERDHQRDHLQVP